MNINFAGWFAFIEKLIQLIIEGHNTGLYDQNGQPLNTIADLHAHVDAVHAEKFGGA